MRPMSFLATAVAAAAVLTLGAVSPSDAACRKMGFLVNDYGKDGPTKDAQSLLDKDIAKWAAEKGIAKYDVSKRDVSCELFLNFIVFDEHTCTASATVCWDEKNPGKAGATPVVTQDAKAPADAPAKAASTPAPDAAKPEAKTAAQKPAAEAKPEKATAKVETGTVTSKAAAEKPAAAEAPAVTGQPAAASEKDASKAAAAAAERAAAAAERAAVAAERAAQAAMDAQNQIGAAGTSAAAPAADAKSAGEAAAAVVKPITPLPASTDPSPAP